MPPDAASGPAWGANGLPGGPPGLAPNCAGGAAVYAVMNGLDGYAVGGCPIGILGAGAIGIELGGCCGMVIGVDNGAKVFPVCPIDV